VDDTVLERGNLLEVVEKELDFVGVGEKDRISQSITVKAAPLKVEGLFNDSQKKQRSREVSSK
jgi:hypothetical protein